MMIYSNELIWDINDRREWLRAAERIRNEAEEARDRATFAEWAGEIEEQGNFEEELGEYEALTSEQREAGERADWNDAAHHEALGFIENEAFKRNLEHREIARAWALAFTDEYDVINTYENYAQSKNHYIAKISQAVFDMELNAEISRMNQQGIMKIIPTSRVSFAILMEDKLLAWEWGVDIFLEIYIDRDDFREWLKNFKQLPLVEGCLLKKWLGSFEAEAQVQNSHDEIKPPSLQDKKKRTRKINLSRAIYAAVEKFGRKPSFDELWQYFQDDKDETNIIQDFTDTHLTWMDTRGKLHDTPKRNVENHLCRIKS